MNDRPAIGVFIAGDPRIDEPSRQRCRTLSKELMAATVESLRKQRIVIRGKHGVMARSDQSVKRAADRIGYAETGAKYEYLIKKRPDAPPAPPAAWFGGRHARRARARPPFLSHTPYLHPRWPIPYRVC